MSGTINFDIDSTNYNSPLGVEIWLNQNKIIDVAHVQSVQPITVTVPDTGAQQLKITLKNKTANDTVIDQDNNIVQDSCLTVKNFKFDGVAVDQLVSETAVYRHSFNSTQPEIDDEFYWVMGCNGTVHIDFYTPIYIWLLEHM